MLFLSVLDGYFASLSHFTPLLLFFMSFRYSVTVGLPKILGFRWIHIGSPLWKNKFSASFQKKNFFKKLQSSVSITSDSIFEALRPIWASKKQLARFYPCGRTLQCLAHFVPPGTRGTKWTDSKTEPRLFADLTEASQAPDKCSLALLAAFRVPYNTWKLRFGKVGSFRTPQVGSFRRGFWSISHPMFQGGYEMSWALQIRISLNTLFRNRDFFIIRRRRSVWILFIPREKVSSVLFRELLL